ncbi:MAG: protein kinase, partial [Bacteroidetes bacterium]|nr:protein kinase [Bacteroidota bacterium]
MMTPSSWDRVNALLDAVLTLPAHQRETYLQRECADDPALRREVRSLLRAHDQADTFLSTPAHELLPPMAGPDSSHQDAHVGQEIDGYRILDVLGRGGMGVVYKVKNLTLDRVEALKVIAPFLVRDDQFLRRFQIEARALAKIHHTNIVTVHTLRESELGHYLTMEYVDGDTLADVLEAQGALPWKTALRIYNQLLEAFDYAHARGIIHRDIKPRNIMLTADETVKVMDFGLAKFYLKQDVTQTAGVSGTLCYMSPEQIRGAKLDQRSDLFSLGLTLYEMVSGQLPFDRHDSQFGIQRAIVEETFEPPHQRNSAVPERLSQIIMRALEKDPDRRYQRARDMLDDLQAFSDDTVDQQDWPTVTDMEARQEPTAAWTRLPWRRGLVGLALAVVLVGGGYAFGPSLWSAVGGGTAPPTDEIAQNDARTASDDATPDDLSDAPLESAPQDDAEGNVAEPQEQVTTTTDTSTETTSQPRETAIRPSPSTQSDAPAADQAPQPSPETNTAAEETGAEETGTEETTAPEDDASPTETEEATTDAPPETPPAEEPVAENAPSPAERATETAQTWRSHLERALLRDEWSALPPPIVDFYREKRDDLSRKFQITDADVLIDEGR